MKRVGKAKGLLQPENLKILRFLQTAENRKQTEVAAVLDDSVKSEWNAAKPFLSIPGPKTLPLVGNLWRFLPFATFGKMDLMDVHQKLYEEYGSIVRLSGMGKMDQVLLFDPAFVEKMFRNESVWPLRIGLNSLKYYRNVTRKDFYEDCEGLVTSQGQQWQDFRSATNQAMMQPKNVKMYLSLVAAVIDDFIERIRYIRRPDGEMPENFLSEINKMALESFTVVTLDIRLGCLSNDLDPNSETVRMIENVKNALAYMHMLDFTPNFWMYISTPLWRKFVKTMNEILEFSIKYTTAKWEELKKQEYNEGNHSLLETLLLKTKNPKIPIVMATDVLFAGIDTTSNTLAGILYHLAINPEKQDKLYQELKQLFPAKNSPIDGDMFNELKYTRAVIKESMRLRPTTLGNQRTAVKDMVFGEYQIPKGTSLIASHSVMCRICDHYKDTEKFLPERWLKSESKSELSSKNVHPFVFLPFGFGQRSCIGRRFAELEMDLAVSKIIRNFKVSYDHEPMTWMTRVVSCPQKPLKFKMVERPE